MGDKIKLYNWGIKKRIMCAVLAAVLINCEAVSALDITSKAACVMNPETGEFYYEYNADEPLAPASMTKVMTAYVIYQKIEEGAITKDTLITADAQDEALSRDGEATNVLLTAGNTYSIDELLDAIMVVSACAACSMVGKYLCGSEEEFVHLMNDTVGRLGLEAYYEDASGMSDNNRISARSMAALSSRLIKDYPDILNHTSKTEITIDGKVYKSTNAMLPGGAIEYWGVDGLKTGTTDLAGCCNTSTAVHDGIRLISVTMHSDFGTSRFDDSVKLLNTGFDTAYFLYENLISTDMSVKLNGYEMPSFRYGGPRGGLCLIVEDMKDYGFDVSWNEETKTVTAKYDPKKKIKPISLEPYKEYPVGSGMYKILKDSSVKVKIEYGNKGYTVKNVYPLGDYTAISADELKRIAESCKWNGAEKCLDIKFGKDKKGEVNNEKNSSSRGAHLVSFAADCIRRLFGYVRKK